MMFECGIKTGWVQILVMLGSCGDYVVPRSYLIENNDNNNNNSDNNNEK